MATRQHTNLPTVATSPGTCDRVRVGRLGGWPGRGLDGRLAGSADGLFEIVAECSARAARSRVSRTNSQAAPSASPGTAEPSSRTDPHQCRSAGPWCTDATCSAGLLPEYQRAACTHCAPYAHMRVALLHLREQ